MKKFSDYIIENNNKTYTAVKCFNILWSMPNNNLPNSVVLLLSGGADSAVPYEFLSNLYKQEVKNMEYEVLGKGYVV